MAYTALAAQAVTKDGLQPVFTAAPGIGAGNGSIISPGDILWVKNGSGGSINVTLITGSTLAGRSVADEVVAVPAGQDRVFGGLGQIPYAQESGADAGKIYVEYSAIASITVAAFRQ